MRWLIILPSLTIGGSSSSICKSDCRSRVHVVLSSCLTCHTYFCKSSLEWKTTTTGSPISCGCPCRARRECYFSQHASILESPLVVDVASVLGNFALRRPSWDGPIGPGCVGDWSGGQAHQVESLWSRQEAQLSASGCGQCSICSAQTLAE